MIRRKYRINRVKCDQENDREYCFPIPYTEMEKVPGGPRCKWVQKQECIDAPIVQPKCEHPPNQMCVVCDTFRRDNGFGSCPTNNCGSFVPGGMWGDGGDFNGPNINDGGAIPMDIDDGSMGGDGGYFPGQEPRFNGGQGGYFPGGSNGGQGGYFPGQGGRNPYEPPNIFNSGFANPSGDNNMASLNDENVMNDASSFAEGTHEDNIENLQNR